MPPRKSASPAAKTAAKPPQADAVAPAAPVDPPVTEPAPVDPPAPDGDTEPPAPVTDPDPVAPTGTAAAPIASPEELAAQRSPHLGIDHLSTNPVAANATIQSPAGSSHARLLDDDGNDVALTDLFHFPELSDPHLVATVKRRVYQEFTYPNTTTPTTHLLYPAGVHVPIAEALRVLDTFKYADESERP